MPSEVDRQNNTDEISEFMNQRAGEFSHLGSDHTREGYIRLSEDMFIGICRLCPDSPKIPPGTLRYLGQDLGNSCLSSITHSEEF
ncbi:hypothetical protein JW796_02725 [Candidatus Dojkabacteria bacterium]|nr:hypothetical protein [Candidatus Dojkabacteria bacterium]